jgi:hypothetical protein
VGSQLQRRVYSVCMRNIVLHAKYIYKLLLLPPTLLLPTWQYEYGKVVLYEFLGNGTEL